MGAIYSAAQVTLVAAAGSDPSYGLPGVLSRPRLVPASRRIRNMWLKPVPRFVQLAEVAESAWASRAWTFQEFYRSRRRLIFTESRVIFVCNSEIKYEIALSINIWPGSGGSSSEDGHWLRRWLPHYGVASDERSVLTAIDRAAGHLQAYSSRNLTDDSDSLDAIAGALDSHHKDFVYHVWGALFRQAAEYTNDSPSARLQYCNDACSVCGCGRSFPIKSRQSTTENDNRLDPVPLSGLQDHHKMDIPFAHQTADRSSMVAHPQQSEMALTWYHHKRARRRPGFPSWSSLGWEGPISWYRLSPDNEDSPIALTHACRARVHFARFSCDLLDYSLPGQESIDSIPPLLEITVRMTKLDLVLDGKYSQVALGMSANYKYILRLDWDVDPTSLNSKQLVGALLDGHAGQKPESFMLLLAQYGDVLERVGLVYLPRSRSLLRVDGMRQNDLMPLAGLAERIAANTFLRSYSSDYGAWWQNIFGDYRPIVIG